MRMMSFALTTAQIRQRTKTVTRRMGWKGLQPGTLLQPVVQSQGLKKGQTVEKIGAPIRVLRVDRVVLSDISPGDVHREGFPGSTAAQFIRLFKQANGCTRSKVVTRIAFEYTEEE